MQPEQMRLDRNDWVPNNPRLPVLVYRGALQQAGEVSAEAAEALFARNGWPARWRGGIFDYHHYHSVAHEALGVAAGSARVTLGGPGGPEVSLKAGDVAVLPAGTGHCRVAADDEFLVVGAYPEGTRTWDICRQAPSEAALERIAQVPLPAGDPVEGAGGPSTTLWARA